MELLLLMVAMFAMMYFLMIRPQQKKMRQEQEMRAQLGEGDRVLLTSGIFGTIAHVGERQMIVELAPGVEITVLKGNVARTVTAEDEEFEFTDEVDELEAEEYANDEEYAEAEEAVTPEVEVEVEEAVTPEVEVEVEEAVTPEVEDAASPKVEPVVEAEVPGTDKTRYQPWQRQDPATSTEEKPRPEDSK